MPVLTRGIFKLDLGVFKIHAEVSEEDRQCAWELYTEICTRVSLTGKINDQKCEDFSGEVLVESLDSVHTFFREARSIMRKFPVGQLKHDKNKHLGILINNLIVYVLRPFLEKWQANFRHWWNLPKKKNNILSPFERQKLYPQYKEFITDWQNMRLIMRELQRELVKAYKLIDVSPINEGN